MIEELRVVDIFAGIGGMTQAFKEAGFRKITGIDKDVSALRVYNRNHGSSSLYMDILSADAEDLPPVDILAGRLPAMYTAKAGTIYREEEKLFYDNVLPEILKRKQPRALLFELKGRSVENCASLFRILEAEEYYFCYKRLNLEDYGGISGHYFYIIAVREEIKEIIFPRKRESTLDFLEKGSVKDVYYWRNFQWNIPHEKGRVYSWNGNGYEDRGKVVWNLFRPPVVYDGFGVRKITHKELQRLKGFPDGYDTRMNQSRTRYQYIAAASNVEICRFLARELWELLTEGKEIAPVPETRTQAKLLTTEKKAEKQDVPERKENTQEKRDVKKCFVIMPFEEKLDTYYYRLIKPTMEKKGYEVKRADEIYGNRPIIDDITFAIREADILIADATGKNPNVNYELGYAHALNKQVIIITQDINDIPFDYRHRRAIVYRTSDVDWQEELKEKLVKTVEAIGKS